MIAAHELLQLIIATLSGTSAMTLQSYIVSDVKGRQFREPEVLAALIRRLFPVGKVSAAVQGWIVHYTVGIMFSSVYHVLWKKTKIKPTLLSGATLGAISGVIGILVWKKTLELHPNPPAIDVRRYYGHLLVAHIVFGIADVTGHRMKGR